MHIATRIVLAGGAAAILTGCSSGESAEVNPDEGYLLLEVRDHIEDEGHEVLGGSGSVSSGPAGGSTELSAEAEEASIYVACRGDLAEAEFRFDDEELDISCEDEGAVQLMESNYELEGPTVEITREGVPDGTEWAIGLGSTAEEQN